jgi:hypothetical protein
MPTRTHIVVAAVSVAAVATLWRLWQRQRSTAAAAAATQPEMTGRRPARLSRQEQSLLRSSTRPLEPARQATPGEMKEEGLVVRKRFAAFISHFKAEAAAEARLLQMELEAVIGGRCFLDSDDLKDLRLLEQAVRDSDALVLLQSKSVLTRPWCLIELMTAIDAGVPIVGVALISGAHAYSFEGVQNFLADLDTSLDASNSGAKALLEGHGINVADAAFKLSSWATPLEPFALLLRLAAPPCC